MVNTSPGRACQRDGYEADLRVFYVMNLETGEKNVSLGRRFEFEM